MSLRRFLVFAAGVILAMPVGRCAGQTLSPAQENYREVARLLNIVKKAPQAEYRQYARIQLEQRGISRVDVVYALTLDQWLLEPDFGVVYRTSAKLGQMRSPARLLAVTNLRNLIAAENDPDLLWMHAVTLSSIVPEMGNALDVLQQIPEDPVLAETLGREILNPDSIARSDSERAISEIALGWREYRQLEAGLKLARHGDPGDSPFIVSDFSLAPTLVGTRPAVAEKEKKPHPLIALRKFDVVLHRMKEGSEDHWIVFEDNASRFPQPYTARIVVSQAFQSDLAKSQRAMRALRSLGEDGESAAALVDAMLNVLNFSHAVDRLDSIEQPGPYVQEALRRARRHGYPQVRAAVVRAMSRSPELSGVLASTLRESLLSSDREMREAIQKTVADGKIANPITGPWLEEQILSSDDLDSLSMLVGLFKGLPVTAEFPEKLFQRIDLAKSPELNLVFIRCLLDHADPNSESAAKLRLLEAEIESTYARQVGQQLANDLRWMIEQSEIVKRQISQQQLDQLEQLKRLD